MSIILASTWHPRGETKRFRKLYPLLASLYQQIVIVVPPQTHAGLVLSLRLYERTHVVAVEHWAAGRYEALKQAAQLDGQAIHYADMDRLIRWAETRPEELKRVVSRLDEYDCLVIGRSRLAYDTHPQSLVKTEALSNQVFSHILGKELDISAGSKSFSKAAADFIVANSEPVGALGTDSEWVVLARRGGYLIDYVMVDGLDWESADQYANVAADDTMQRKAAAEYDADPENWKHRVAVAHEIINMGLEALKRPIKSPEQQ